MKDLSVDLLGNFKQIVDASRSVESQIVIPFYSLSDFDS